MTMKTAALPLTTLCLAVAGWFGATTSPAAQDPAPIVKVADDERVDMQPRVSDLDFLAGVWTGSDGTSEWESCYTTGTGGVLVGASKEMRDGGVIMMEFEHFYEKDGTVRLRPYPFGKRSVEFELTRIDTEEQRVVFANLDHDFPKTFIYHRTSEQTLEITLQGDMGGQAAKIVLEYTKKDV
jgi:hypothetical protein